MADPWEMPESEHHAVHEIPIAFSLDRVILHGTNVLRQAPGPVFGAALAAATAELLPIAVANGLSIVGSVAFTPGSSESMLLSLASTAVQFGGLLLAVPFIPLFSYGAMASIAKWAAGEPLTFGGIVTSFIPAIRAFLTQVLLGVLRLLVAIVFLVPALVLVGVALTTRGDALFALGTAAAALVVLWVPVVVFLALRFAIADVVAAVDDDGWPVHALVQSWKATGTASGLVTIGVLALIGCCADGILGGLLGMFLIGIPLIAAVHAVLRSGMALAWLEASRSPEALGAMPYFRDLKASEA